MDRLQEWRTREARGEGTDVRLVLGELLLTCEEIERLDHDLAGLLGGGLVAALAEERDLTPLEERLEGADLEEVTTRARDLQDSLAALRATLRHG